MIITLEGSTFSPDHSWLTGYTLTNNQLAITRSNGYSTTLVYEIVEYTGVKSLQRGLLARTGGATKRNVSISQINMNKSILTFSLPLQYYNHGENNYEMSYGAIESSSNVSFLTLYSQDMQTPVCWNVIEFN